MNISVEYKDTTGAIFNQTHRLTRLAFAKHLAIAGQGYAPCPQKLFRTLGMFLHYSYYLQRQAFYNNHFSRPPRALSDPTEQGQFSTLAGKAIADFLSKRINQSLHTTNYEAVASKPLRGQRPDLVAFTQTSQFTLEAKGRHQTNPGNMTKHKAQAASGNYPRNFSIASVSYNLFGQVTCKYHDPFNDNIQYDNEMLQKITKKYYAGLAQFLNRNYFDYQEFYFQGEEFYEVELSYRKFEKLFIDNSPYRYIGHFEVFDFFRPKLILPKNINEYAENGITNTTRPFLFDIKNQDENTYIDNDRVGLRIKQ
ncbi:MAG TPA: hypothetical protein VK718_06170 [Ferruginibacter sp.]|jgi:hypothetical protein|nr:hypothetical protein [Ferruginibacter sp.]